MPQNAPKLYRQLWEILNEDGGQGTIVSNPDDNFFIFKVTKDGSPLRLKVPAETIYAYRDRSLGAFIDKVLKKLQPLSEEDNPSRLARKSPDITVS